MKGCEYSDDLKIVDRSNKNKENNEMMYEINEDYLLAGNPQTNGRVLNELAKSEDLKVRKRVAENPSSCLATLYRLLFDSEADVRLSLSYNQYVPEFFIEHLVYDPDDDVRFALAENSRLTQELLTILVNDENPYVASRASKSLKQTCCGPSGCAA